MASSAVRTELNELLEACVGVLRQADDGITDWFAERLSAHHEDPVETRPVSPPSVPLPEFSNLDSPTTRRSVEAVARASDSLAWFQSDTVRVPPGWAHKAAAVELVGPDGMIEAPDLRFGVFYIEAGTHYPTHWHAADEFYLVVAGAGEWVIDGADPIRLGPGGLVLTSSMAPHSLTTEIEPLLMLWGWSGRISFAEYGY